jgi:5S rRNA maturation endonuclease (ribonuclease M5)
VTNIVVEGESDRETAKAVVRAADRTVAKVIVTGGKSRLDPRISKYNEAARRSSWIVFRDSDGDCPRRLREELTSSITTWSPNFSLRIAHSMTEAWLLADRQNFADFFRIRVGRVPRDSEAIPHAKQEVLRLCAESTSRTIRQNMVRATGEIGALYVSTINEFAASRWDVDTAAAIRSESLRRAIQRIRELP